MKTLTLAVLAAVAVLSGCASAPRQAAAPNPKVLQCQAQPTYFLTDAGGAPATAVFVCFREDGVMTYQLQRLTPEQGKAVAAALTPKTAAPARARSKK